MSDCIQADRILIIDFGAQYTQLIARRVREAGVYCQIQPFDVEQQAIKEFAPKGVILSGGPETVRMEFTPRVPDIIFKLNIPVLGICYGMQAMAVQLGGEVEASAKREFGFAQVRARGHSQLLRDIEDHVTPEGYGILDVWMSHGDRVTKLPPEFSLIANSDSSPIAGMADEERGYYALQFHPEVTHTRQGARILERFVHEICQCDSKWTPQNIIVESIKNAHKLVGKDKVMLGLSGGVDSAVTAALLQRSLEDQLVCIFVNNGLLRLNEAEQVKETFGQHLGVRLIYVDACDRFYQALEGVTDPEQKRKVIGNLFIKVFEEEADKLANVKWLAQGTIYPDVVESAATKYGKTHVIKSHHNVGGLPENMKLKLLEPLRELFKDEVRKIGLELGLPYDMVYRHPFPGPGLGVRILGEVKKEYTEVLCRADAIFIEELHKHDYYHKVSQAFAVFLPVKSVGVVGDQREYGYVIALRAVETIDFMTAQWAQIPFELLAHVSNRIINEIAGVSRVTYDISGKPPATIEWE